MAEKPEVEVLKEKLAKAEAEAKAAQAKADESAKEADDAKKEATKVKKESAKKVKVPEVTTLEIKPGTRATLPNGTVVTNAGK